MEVISARRFIRCWLPPALDQMLPPSSQNQVCSTSRIFQTNSCRLLQRKAVNFRQICLWTRSCMSLFIIWSGCNWYGFGAVFFGCLSMIIHGGISVVRYLSILHPKHTRTGRFIRNQSVAFLYALRKLKTGSAENHLNFYLASTQMCQYWRNEMIKGFELLQLDWYIKHRELLIPSLNMLNNIS